ncbi:MAG TPA: M3 family peptidase, partial [Campylobacterales bacterium]|nr:M3 family peptidase [Campylobacterales bacterium]
MSYFPDFPDDLKTLKEQSIKQIEKNRKKIKKLLKEPNKNFKTFVLPLLELDEKLSFYTQPIFHLNGVKNGPKSQKIVKELLPILSEYSTEISQNEELYAALKTVYESEKDSLTTEQKTALEQEIKDFELEGVGLDEDKKRRIAEINEQLSELQNDFSQNVLDDTNA